MATTAAWNSVPPMDRGGRILVASWALFLVGAAWLTFGTPLQTDLSLFMPRSAEPTERLLLEQLREGPAARLILMAVEGGTEVERAEVVKGLAARLRASSRFSRVEHGSMALRDEERELLFRYRYLLDPSWTPADFTPEGLRQALAQRLRELKSPFSSLYKRLLPADPTGSLQGLLALLMNRDGVVRRRGVWSSPDGTRALLLAETKAGSLELGAQKENLQLIREGFAATANGSAARLLLTGPAVFGVGSRETIVTQSNWLGAGAVILLALILYAGYRSLPLLLLGALPMLTAVLAGAAGVSLVYGAMHGITLGFGFTLLGITMDYPVHLFSHLSPGGSAAGAMAKIWPTLRLGALTTALGFLGMTASEFPGLAQLGLFSALGLAAAALTTRWVLPPLLHGLGSLPTPRPLPDWLTRTLLRSGRGRWVLVPTMGLATLLVLIAGRATLWEEDLAALSPIPARLIALDRELRADLRAPDVNHMVVLATPDPEQTLQAVEAIQPALETLVVQKLVEGFDSPARYLPSRATQEARQRLLPKPEILDSSLGKALQRLPFRAGLFSPFLEGVAQSRQLPPLTVADLAGTAWGLRIASQLVVTDQGWLAIIPLRGVHSGAELRQWLTEHPLPRGRYLDVKRQANRMISRFRDGALGWLGLGAGSILLVLMAGLRSPLAVLRVLLPVLVALAVASALLVGLGERLSLFHLVSLLLVLGISLDYSLFCNRPESNAEGHRQTLHALTICAASTVALFGLLACSAVPVLTAIGKTVALGVIAAYLLTMALGEYRVRAVQ